MYSNVDAIDFNYDKTENVQLSGTNLQGTSVKVDIPFLVMMHGSIYSQVSVSTNGALVFGSTFLTYLAFKIQVGYSSSNQLNSLVTWKTSSNFTIEYNATNTDNNLFTRWWITLYKDGFEKFMVQVDSNSTGTNQFCEVNGCFQTIPVNPAVYSSCASSKCPSNLKSCSNEQDCRSAYPDCYTEGVANCVNEIALTIALSVLSGVFAFLTCIVNIIRCMPLICQICERCNCNCNYHCDCSCFGARCCCCPVEPPIEPPVAPPNLEQGSELTELHHPIKIDELEKLNCAICMDAGITIMTTCEHYFHWACLKLWLDKKKECPYCRNHLNNVYYQQCKSCKQFLLPLHGT
jgi:hypothetical protein